MRAFKGVALFIAIAAAALWLRPAVHTSAQEVLPIPVVTAGEKLRDGMKLKLDYTQQILNGLVLRDFDSIKSAATALKQITLHDPKQIEGDQTDNDLYEHFRLEFLRISTQVEQLAGRENLEGTAFAYQNLTANCLACHSYLSGDTRVTLLKAE